MNTPNATHVNYFHSTKSLVKNNGSWRGCHTDTGAYTGCRYEAAMPSRARSEKILACANSLWNLNHFRGDLLNALQQQGYAIEVAAPTPPEGEPSPWPTSSFPICNDGLNPLQDGLTMVCLANLIRSKGPSAFLSWTPKPNIYGSITARLLGVPAIPNVSGLGTAFIRGGPLQWLLCTLYRVAFFNAPVVFFQNSEDLQFFVARGLVRVEQARLLPGSGIDLSHFRAMPMPVRQPGEGVLLFVGRLLGDKGVRELVSAARLLRARHTGARFQILGQVGTENRTAIPEQQLEEWIEEGIVEYLGSTADVRPYIAQADAVILPSYREGMPRSLLEAAASARPMLGSDVPGNREIIDHGVNGLLFKSHSAEALAEACLRFLQMPHAEREQMGAEARKTAEERFSKQQVIDAYLAALDDVLGPRRIAHGVR